MDDEGARAIEVVSGQRLARLSQRQGGAVSASIFPEILEPIGRALRWGVCMIRRTLPGLAVFALVAGLSGMLIGHSWNRYCNRLQSWDLMESTNAFRRAKQGLPMTYGVTGQPVPPTSNTHQRWKSDSRGLEMHKEKASPTRG